MTDYATVVYDDEEMIRSLKENERPKRKAEEELFNRHVYFIKEGMNKYSLDQEDAFNAYSDTILQAIDNIVKTRFESRSTIKTYLYRIFNNKCVDLIRKKTTHKSSIHQTAPVSDMLEMISDPAKTIIQELIEKNDMALLQTKLDETGENCKKLLAMFAEGFSDKEIANSMEYKSADVVKTSRLRCLDKLRQLYNAKKS
ncbi:MAG: sigma-70 family RNA polymerase sigma factor [Ginsengibacter sp.]